MVVRCSNPVPFVVVADDTETRTGIHLAVYSGADPATLIDLLPDTFDRRWTDELNGPGSGSFKVHADNPRLESNPGILDYGNVVRFNLDRRDRFAIQVEHIDRAQVVGPDGVSRRTLTVTGRGILSKLEEAIAYPQIDGNPVRGFPGITPGHLTTVLLDEAILRGALVGITWNFDENLDSNNAPWVGELHQTERAGTDLLRIVRRIGELAADVHMTPVGLLRMFNTRGFDRSVAIDTDEAVILRPGENIVELTRSEDGAIRNALLIETPAGFIERDDAASIATYRRREAFLSLGNADDADPDQLDLVAGAVFRRSAEPAAHLTVEITDAVTYPRPYWHFDVGDWVLAPDDDGTLTRYRVRGLTISESPDGRHIIVTPELATITEELDLRLERWLASMARGTLAGTAAVIAEPVRESAEVQAVTTAALTAHEAAADAHPGYIDAAELAAALDALELDDLVDVDLTTDPPDDEDVLTFETTSGLWVPKPSPGGGGGAWTQDVSSPLTSLTEVTTGAGTWTIDGGTGQLQVVTPANTQCRAHSVTSLAASAVCIVEVEVQIPAGFPAASTAHVRIGASPGDAARAPNWGIRGDGFAYCENDAIAAISTIAYTIPAAGTWVKMRMLWSGGMLTGWLDGVRLTDVMFDTGTRAGASWKPYVVTYNGGTVRWRNLKAWTLTLPA